MVGTGLSMTIFSQNINFLNTLIGNELAIKLEQIKAKHVITLLGT